METDKFFNISLVCSLLGIFLLIIFCNNYELKEMDISSIDESYIDQKVKISGTIKNLFETKGLYIFDIEKDSESMKAILFKDNKTILRDNLDIILEGKITEYEDELEIISQRITIK